jgi:hypothetical protein
MKKVSVIIVGVCFIEYLITSDMKLAIIGLFNLGLVNLLREE